MQYLHDRDFVEKVFEDLIAEWLEDADEPPDRNGQPRGSLEPRLSKIKAKTLILWGDSDRAIDPSAVQVFEREIKNHRTVIMKSCGHVPMLERPEEAARHYLAFLG